MQKIYLLGFCLIYLFPIRSYGMTMTAIHTREHTLHQTQTESVTFVQFSDLHSQEGFEPQAMPEAFHALAQAINEPKGDFIVFTGDLFDANSPLPEDLMPLITFLEGLTAPLGKYAVLGNHDITNEREVVTRTVLESGGFTVLTNEVVSLNDETLKLYGLNSVYAKTDHTPVLEDVEEAAYNVVLLHEPDPFDAMKDSPFQLQLSGHSHGGQVVIDGKPLGVTPFAEKYVDGYYTLEETGKHLIVNRGIGYSRIPIRLNCPATIDVIHLVNDVAE